MGVLVFVDVVFPPQRGDYPTATNYTDRPHRGPDFVKIRAGTEPPQGLVAKTL